MSRDHQEIQQEAMKKGRLIKVERGQGGKGALEVEKSKVDVSSKLSVYETHIVRLGKPSATKSADF